MESWTIARQIGFLSKVLMAALVVLTVVGIGSTLRLGTLFSDFKQSANFANVAMRISEALFEAEIAELRYRRSNDAADATKVKERLAEVYQLEQDFLALASDSEAETAAK
jgi:hypothetical protein